MLVLTKDIYRSMHLRNKKNRMQFTGLKSTLKLKFILPICFFFYFYF